MTHEVYVEVPVNLDALAVRIAESDYDSVMEFIKTVDSYIADYEFTRMLRDWAVAEMENEDKES